MCRQRRHEWKFERRSLSNIESMSAEDALEVKADKGCNYGEIFAYIEKVPVVCRNR